MAPGRDLEPGGGGPDPTLESQQDLPGLGVLWEQPSADLNLTHISAKRHGVQAKREGDVQET